jgi:hypothetical protein
MTEIYDGAFRSIRANPRVMFGVPAVVVSAASLVSLVLALWLTPLLAPVFGDAFAASGGDTMGMSDAYSAIYGGALGSLPALSLATPVLTGLLTLAVSRAVIGQRVTAAEVWRTGRRRALLLIPLSILQSLAFALVWVVAAIPAILAGVAGDVGLTVGLTIVAVLLGLVGTAWLTVRTMLIPPALVLEGAPVGASIARGWRLTRGSFWRLLGIWLLASIIVTVVQQVVQTPAGLITGILAFSASSAVTISLMLLSTALGAIISLAFLAPVVALLYIDTRMRREGLDIELTRAAEAAAA